MTERQSHNVITSIVSFEEFKERKTNRTTIPDGPVNTFRIYNGPSKEERDAHKTQQKKLKAVRNKLAIIKGGIS